MEHIAFDHTPMGDAEVARRLRRIGNKRRLCSYLIISAITLLGVMYYIPAFDAPSLDQMSAAARSCFFACAAYIAIAGVGAFTALTFTWSIDDAEAGGLAALDIKGLEELRKLCDTSTQAKVVVSDWLARGATLRVRDLWAVRRLVATIREAEKAREDETSRRSLLTALRGPGQAMTAHASTEPPQ